MCCSEKCKASILIYWADGICYCYRFPVYYCLTEYLKVTSCMEFLDINLVIIVME